VAPPLLRLAFGDESDQLKLETEIAKKES